MNNQSLYEKLTKGFCVLVVGVMIGHAWSYFQYRPYSQELQSLKSEINENRLMALSLSERLKNEYIALAIILCESGGRHDVDGDGGMAYGIAQFHEETFYDLAEKAGLQNRYWKSKKAQIEILKWAIANGYAGEWTCYDKIKKVAKELNG